VSYKSVDEWLDEMEGFATRAERYWEDVAMGNHKTWLNEAWKQGRSAALEEAAKVAEARVEDAEYGTWQAQEGLIIAAAIRKLKT
jgi:hypothetical protein